MSAYFDLAGRTIVVTGAGSGIGAATAKQLAEAGARVACLDISLAGVERTVSEIQGETIKIALDVSSRSAVEAAADQVSAIAPIDGWVNVAGVIDNILVSEMTDERFNRVFDINFRGSLYGAQAAVKAMTDRGGAIVNVVSAAIDTPSPGLAAYAVSKAALAQLTRTLAAEVGGLGIRVNAIAPGFVETAMTSRHFTNDDGSIDHDRREAVFKPMRRISPLGMIGEPEDIAAGIHYLVSDAAKFVTGQILRVNGGAAMP